MFKRRNTKLCNFTVIVFGSLEEEIKLRSYKHVLCRSQWPHRLRYASAAVRLLGFGLESRRGHG
jgi:hypothetical protein